MEQHTFSLTLSPEEYRAILRRRVESCLREAQVPADVVSAMMEAYTRTSAILAPVHRPTVQELRARSVESSPTGKGDQRQKIHWPSSRVQPIEEPNTIADSVLNALFKGCRTVPEIAKETRKPRKAVYTALWALKRNKLIDQGEPSSGQD